MSNENEKKFFWFYVPLILAVLVVLYSVISHTLTKPDGSSVIVTSGHGSSGDNFVTIEPDYSWHFFKRGVIYGDPLITPYREFLNNSFGISFDTFRYFDLSNPTPFMLVVILLIISAFLYRREKR
jgi:hypothetical protein